MPEIETDHGLRTPSMHRISMHRISVERIASRERRRHSADNKDVRS